jgi:hypothetical protein
VLRLSEFVGVQVSKQQQFVGVQQMALQNIAVAKNSCFN